MQYFKKLVSYIILGTSFFLFSITFTSASAAIIWDNCNAADPTTAVAGCDLGDDAWIAVNTLEDDFIIDTDGTVVGGVLVWIASQNEDFLGDLTVGIGGTPGTSTTPLPQQTISGATIIPDSTETFEWMGTNMHSYGVNINLANEMYDAGTYYLTVGLTNASFTGWIWTNGNGTSAGGTAQPTLNGEASSTRPPDDLAFKVYDAAGAIDTPLATPVPAAIWLFGTALIGFVGMARRTKV